MGVCELVMIEFLCTASGFLQMNFGSPFDCVFAGIYSTRLGLRALLRTQKIWWLGEEDQQVFVADRRVNIGFGLTSWIWIKLKKDED